ncbi:nucleotidyltransferase family protein [Oceanobacillus sp. CFH 90083]|uniref:nucleotidyltransferase domain-containing protein n=1 Tax=Oceanobacillus sp. CFH 90083 TaxID=2592336 RepID=UPI00188369B3|nr:nucleotidyltransferase family protein [Oceanobacillus sp. CFH 90083]
MAILNMERLSLEEKLLILASRTNITKESNQIKEILKETIDFNYLVEIASKNKVLQLITPHLIKLDTDNSIKSSDKQLLNFYYLGNKKKNEVAFKELQLILEAFRKNNINAIPLKGIVLVPCVYKDFGLRKMNDLDFLISPNDRTLVSNVLKKIGYSIGKYNWSTDSIENISREEELYWRINTGNLHLHLKLTGEDFLKVVRVDFSYDIDLEKNYKATNSLIDNSELGLIYNTQTKLLESNDFLIHLAIHLYKEATNVQFVLLEADLNLIKFCDLREYILYLNKTGKINWEKISIRAKELRASKALYFSLYFTDYIYGDNFLNEVRSFLDIQNTDFLNEYGSLDYGTSQKWNKSFIERLFKNNTNELKKQKSKLEEFRETLK